MFKLFVFMGLMAFCGSQAWAEYSCQVRVNYSCKASENLASNSCESNYCQKVINWCYAYTKEQGRKFNSEQEIRDKYKKSPEAFAEKFDIKAFIQEWNMCTGGIWTWSEKNRSKYKDGEDGSGGSSENQKGRSDDVGAADLGINMPGSEEPLCLNAARGIEYETDDITRVREGVDSEIYGYDSEGRKKYEDFLHSYLNDRMKRLGLNTGFVKTCLGDLPKDLWRFRFGDETTPLMSMADISKNASNPDFKKLMNTACLQVVLNPQYQDWASLLKLGSRRFNFFEKDEKGKRTGNVKTCENVPDANYFNNLPGNTEKIDPDILFVLNAASASVKNIISIHSLIKDSGVNNINTADAIYSALSFESSARNTYMPQSAILEKVCPLTSTAGSQTGIPMNQDSSPKNIAKIVEAYRKTCSSYDAYYENVKYATTTLSDIVIVQAAGGLIIISGGTAIPVLIGTSVVAGTVSGARDYNSCVAQSDIGKIGLSPDYAKLKYDECYNKFLSSTAKSTLFNIAVGGIGTGVSKIFVGRTGMTIEKYAINEVDNVVPQVLAESTLGQRVLFRTAEQIALFSLNTTSGVVRCLVDNNGDGSKCDVKAIAKEARNSMVIGFMVERAQKLPEIEKLPSPENLKQAVKKVTSSEEYKSFVEKFKLEEAKAAALSAAKLKAKPKFKPQDSKKIKTKPVNKGQKNKES